MALGVPQRLGEMVQIRFKFIVVFSHRDRPQRRLSLFTHSVARVQAHGTNAGASRRSLAQ